MFDAQWIERKVGFIYVFFYLFMISQLNEMSRSIKYKKQICQLYDTKMEH